MNNIKQVLKKKSKLPILLRDKLVEAGWQRMAARLVREIF